MFWKFDNVLGYSPVFGHVTYLGQSHASENILWIIMKNMYRTTNEIRNHRVEGRAIAQPLELHMTWIIYELCYLAEQWPLTEFLYPTRLNFFGINISIKGSCVYWENTYFCKNTLILLPLCLNKVYYYIIIQMSRRIFHGIPLESDRQCSTCRNGQITEDVWNTRFDFPRGCQPFFGRIDRICEDILFKQ